MRARATTGHRRGERPSSREAVLRLPARPTQVVMISRGEPKENRAKVKEHGLTFPIMLQRQWEISQRYAMFATIKVEFPRRTGRSASIPLRSSECTSEAQTRYLALQS